MLYDENADFEEKAKFVYDLLNLTSMHGIEIDPHWNCLEVGGHGGVLAALVAEHVGHVVCTDIVDVHLQSEGRFVRDLVEKLERNGATVHLDRLDFIKANAQRLPFRSGLFDLVYSQNAFEHIPDPAAALRECFRVTRPGGYIYIQFDPVWTADTGSHFQHFLGEPWLHLLENDGTLVQTMKQNGASEEEVQSFLTHMNRLPSSYYLETIPRLVSELGGEIVILHHWSGCADDSFLEHKNLARAAAAVGLDEAALLVRGFRFLIRT